MRRLLAVLVASGVVAALVGGCTAPSSAPPPTAGSPSPSPSAAATSTKQAGDPLPDPATLLKQASKTTRNLTSVHLGLSVIGKVAGMPVKTMKADLTTDNAAVGTDAASAPSVRGGPSAKSAAPRSTAPRPTAPSSTARGAAPETSTAEHAPSRTGDASTAAASGNGKTGLLGAEIEFQFAVFDGHLYVQLPGADWADYGPTSRVYDVTTILNPDDGLANMLANFVDPKVEARETVGDQQTIRITGKVTADAVNKILPQLSATQRMSASVWIQEGGDHQVVQADLEPTRDDSVQVVFSDWNEPVTVAKPADG